MKYRIEHLNTLGFCSTKIINVEANNELEAIAILRSEDLNLQDEDILSIYNGKYTYNLPKALKLLLIKERDLTEDIKRIDSEEQITKWFCERNHIKKEELDKYHRYAIATALKYIKEQE